MSFALISNLYFKALQYSHNAKSSMKKLLFLPLAALMFLLTEVNGANSTSLDPSSVRGLPNISIRTTGKWDLFAEPFTWYASQQTSAVWADIISVELNNTSSFGAQDVGFPWDFGFRVGGGYNPDYDQWDTQLYWTWFRTKAHQSKQVFPEFISTPDGVIATQFIHPEFFAGDLSDQLFKKATLQWTLLFNMFDWELGRSYWVSKGLSLRPFVGLKGGWIHQSMEVQYAQQITTVLTNQSAIEHVKNNFWGVGPVGGINTKWKLRNFGRHFPSLFGDFSAATLWGTWNCNDTYRSSSGKKVFVNSRPWTLGALMFRGVMGLGWDVDFNQGRSHFAAKLGYETQLWLNQLRVATSQIVVLHGDLSLQGVTFNCRFDF